MPDLTHIASMVLNRPLLCTARYAETVLSVLGNRIGVDASELATHRDTNHSQGSYMMDSGVLVMPIHGSMVHRTSGVQAASGMQSYQSMQASVEDAMEDSSVRSIIFDMDTPGGAAAGAFDFADYLADQRGRKPMVAIARDTMASAGYLIGSSADRVIASQTADIGSIGVVLVHLDKSQKLENEGIKPTIIAAGAHKADGNPYEPLSPEVRADIQEEIDRTMGLFVNAVSARRGLTPEAIRDMEARVFSAENAIQAGLADSIGTLESVAAELAANGPRTYPSTSLKGNKMNEDELRAEGATNERARISAILGGDEAAGRTSLAQHFAFNTSMSAEDANAAMAAAPKEVAEAAKPTPAPEAAAPAPLAPSAQEAAVAALAADTPVIGADASAYSR